VRDEPEQIAVELDRGTLRRRHVFIGSEEEVAGFECTHR
jgi:hypothetical protein